MCLQDDKFVNEFKILNNIGRGSFSKVKKVLRQQEPDPNSQDTSGNADENNSYFAMKVCNNLCVLQILTNYLMLIYR